MKTAYGTLLITVLIQSCVSFKPSTLRPAELNGLEIDRCKISSPGPVYMNLFGLIKADLLPAAVRIEFGSTVIYIDPLSFKDTIKADYIFITHNHLDHFSKPEIEKLSGPETIIIGPQSIVKGIKDREVRLVNVGETIEFDAFNCEVVEAYNLQSGMHKQGSNFVGYVFTLDQTRIYVAGDTDFIPEMRELEGIKVAIVPIGEGKTAMNPQTAAQAVNIIHPEFVIPVHYEMAQNREFEFKELVEKDIEVLFFQDPE